MQKNIEDLCAVIMTGGKSSRMGGGIKSFKKFNNKTIFDRIYKILNNQINNIIINTNSEEEYFKKYNKTIIKDKIKGHLGPLAGIHASLNWINKNMPKINWLISVPSDTPFLPKDLISRLYLKAKENNKQIVLAKSNKNIHPVIGIWNINLLESLEYNLLNGERKIIVWAKNHEVDFEEFFEENYDPFFNINYKEDLNKAKEIEVKFRNE
jgi:molybdopterin-guanine dinucleotide biosynthesis protein A